MEDKSIGMTRRLAKFIVGTNAPEIPVLAYEHAKIALMDWFGVTMAGKEEPLVTKLLKYADLMGGKEQATILGYGIKKSVAQAALVNGAASHALDYDDSLLSFLGHPSVTLFPGLLALSEWKGKSGTDFLSAYLIGLKVGVTVASCAGPEHYATGWHATSTMGHLAAAAACSRLLGLDEQQTVYALGIAGTQASGLKRVFGTMCKPFHAGRASEVGVMSSLLAGDGFTSAEDILEGPGGFFAAMKGAVNEDVLSTLGKTWEVENLAQKYHASCHGTHSPIEAALSIFQKEGLSIPEIKAITVHVNQLMLSAAHMTDANTGLEGKFCIPYCVANALLRGNTGMQAFTDDKVADPEVKALMKKIFLQCDSQIPAVSAEARVEIETTAGRKYSALSDVMKDVPELKVKRVKIRSKFTDLCSTVLGDQKTKRLEEIILSLEKMENMTAFIALL